MEHLIVGASSILGLGISVTQFQNYFNYKTDCDLNLIKCNLILENISKDKVLFESSKLQGYKKGPLFYVHCFFVFLPFEFKPYKEFITLHENKLIRTTKIKHHKYDIVYDFFGKEKIIDYESNYNSKKYNYYQTKIEFQKHWKYEIPFFQKYRYLTYQIKSNELIYFHPSKNLISKSKSKIKNYMRIKHGCTIPKTLIGLGLLSIAPIYIYNRKYKLIR